LTYTITDYDKRYKPYDRSGNDLKRADWVKLPVNPKGDGLQRLLEYPRCLEIFGIWCLLLEKATSEKNPENRGKLLNQKEEPASIPEIANSISLKSKTRLVEIAVNALVEMGWVKAEGTSGNFRQTSPKSRVEKSSVEKSNKRDFPEKLNHQKFIQVWTDWEKHRKEIKHPLTPLASARQLKMLSVYSVDEAIAIIEKSIQNQWRGLFPEKSNTPGQPKKTKLFPIPGKTCSHSGCGLPAVYKNTSGQYDNYVCTNHLPAKVKELYE
jgi:hypothetical protein